MRDGPHEDDSSVAPAAGPDETIGTTIAGGPAAIGGGVDAAQRSSIGRSAAILTMSVLPGQVFGVIRELYVAARVGTSPSLDAYLIALVLPTMLVALLVGGTATAMVPAVVGAKERLGESEAQRLVGAILTWAAIVSLVAGVLLVALAPIAIAVTGPGLAQIYRAEAETFILILAPSIVFGALAGLLVAVHQIHERFRAVALAWFTGPLVALVVTVTLWDGLGVAALATSTTASAMAMFVVLAIAGLRSRSLPRPSVRASRAEVAGFGRHAAPLWASSAVGNLTVLGDRAVASVISAGAVSTLRFGDAILRLPGNTLGVAWTTVIYPSLVRAARPGAARQLADEAETNLRFMVCVYVPLSVATAAMAPLIIDVVYRRGAFDDAAAAATSGVLAALAPLLVLAMANAMLAGAHNARQNGRLLLGAGVLSVVLNIILDVVLGWSLGVAGVALAATITLAVVVAVLAWRLTGPDTRLRIRPVLTVAGKALMASLVPGLPIGLLVWTRSWSGPTVLDLAVLATLTLIGVMGYLATARIIRLEEPYLVIRASTPKRSKRS
jgi:putative peptidoglycan lipid II flippase